jgi:hypothetical protein
VWKSCERIDGALFCGKREERGRAGEASRLGAAMGSSVVLESKRSFPMTKPHMTVRVMRLPADRKLIGADWKLTDPRPGKPGFTCSGQPKRFADALQRASKIADEHGADLVIVDDMDILGFGGAA